MKISLIYMAAGNSRRFGMNKLLYEIEGKPMYKHLLERLVRICMRHFGWEVLVVTQFPEIQEEIQRMRQAGTEGEGMSFFPLREVFSPQSVQGTSWTIRAGIEAAKGAQACVFFVADQPYLTEETAEAFLEKMEREMESVEGQALGCVSFEGEPGNPVWFSDKYFPELLMLQGDQGGRRVLRAHLDEAVYFPIEDAGELADLDSMPERGL